jgi:hypothetical protein
VIVLPSRGPLLAVGVPLNVAVSTVSATELSSSSSLVVWVSEASWNSSPMSGDATCTSFAREIVGLGPAFPVDGIDVVFTDGYLALRNAERGE